MTKVSNLVIGTFSVYVIIASLSIVHFYDNVGLINILLMMLFVFIAFIASLYTLLKINGKMTQVTDFIIVAFCIYVIIASLSIVHFYDRGEIINVLLMTLFVFIVFIAVLLTLMKLTER